jgi:hypothetical protein
MKNTIKPKDIEKRIYEKDSEAFRIIKGSNITKLLKGKMGYSLMKCGIIAISIIFGLIILAYILTISKEINIDIREMAKYYFAAMGVLFAGTAGYNRGSSD